TLAEVSPMWATKLKLIKAAYPDQLICASDIGIGGGAILSSRPMSGERCFDRGTFATAAVNLNGRQVHAVALHLGWPWPVRQLRQIGRLAEPLAAFGDDAIMAGDCNAAPWSAAVHRLAGQSGMTIMPSVGPTWLWRRLPDALHFAGLPIDQVFSKGGVTIHSAQKLAPAGSDHLPILVEFSVRPKEPQDDSKTATVSAAPHPATAGAISG
ncbi:MAG: endonuclease/exonuclease/phosphatase family protein, partial [Mesorhizobium sp.]|nr:endonuclease/exonuclease/phosphatase family protein [Mesorhizobium sp.]